MDVVYLTIDGVMELHTIAIENGGGIGGIRSQQQLASVSANRSKARSEKIYIEQFQRRRCLWVFHS